MYTMFQNQIVTNFSTQKIRFGVFLIADFKINYLPTVTDG